jgi:anion-transporting  ArsA/GET3 family ATPase
VRLDAILNRRLLIVSGKGGVGKTTAAATLGVLAARRGLRVLVAEVEGKGTLSGLFNADPLTQKPSELRPGLYGLNISPEEALREYLGVAFGMRRIARPIVASQLIYYITHAAPGLRDILMLGKLWHMATREREFDLFVLDTPAAGHTVSMLRSPEGFLHAVPIGPLASHTRQMLKWLQDPDQVSIHLVTLPEEMPVNETIETTQLLEERLGMDVLGVFVNMVYPPVSNDPGTVAEFEKLEGPGGLIERAKQVGHSLSQETARYLYECADFYRDRRAIQQSHRAELARAVAHTAPLVDLPFLFLDSFGIKELELLADALEAETAS